MPLHGLFMERVFSGEGIVVSDGAELRESGRIMVGK